MAEDTFQEQVQVPAFPLQRIIFGIVLVTLVVFTAIVAVRHFQTTDPYVEEVLALQGDRERGEAIFQMNCAVCHGVEGSGEVGPSLLGVSDRRSRVNLINQVVGGNTPPMPQFQPEPQDMADLLRYLETL